MGRAVGVWLDTFLCLPWGQQGWTLHVSTGNPAGDPPHVHLLLESSCLALWPIHSPGETEARGWS